ncbi:MAG: channel protein hemolysin family [Frankiales bacterium]|nr:channel protein hemolysin family [Frankiales bacterium]
MTVPLPSARPATLAPPTTPGPSGSLHPSPAVDPSAALEPSALTSVSPLPDEPLGPSREFWLTEVKPRMRGWLHAGAAAVSIITGVVLVVVAATVKSTPAFVSTAVYSVTIFALFGVSGLYHRLTWGPTGQAVMKRLDHSMIFVFIAGTYTPVAVLALPRSTATVVLLVVWSGACAGVLLKLSWPGSPRWVGVPLYLCLGWVAVFVLPELLRGGGTGALVLIALGGLAYTVGGLAYAFKRPNPFPATFGYHEVFHACTIVAATCHYIAIWLIVFHPTQ